MEKKKHDIIKDTRGIVRALKSGHFEKSHALSSCSGSPFNDADYISIKKEACIYRMKKSSQNDPTFVDFLKRQK